MSIYKDEGYENRKDYLNHLADDFGIERDIVYGIASMPVSYTHLTRLVTALEDYAEENY